MATTPPIRMIDLPGVQTLEDKLLIYQGSDIEPWLEDVVDSVSKLAFGITHREVEFDFPDTYWELEDGSPEIERLNAAYDAYNDRLSCDDDLSDDEIVAILLPLGVDFRDERGIPLRCTKLLGRQAEAAAKGIKGRMPDRGLVGLESWASKMEKDARSFRHRGRT